MKHDVNFDLLSKRINVGRKADELIITFLAMNAESNRLTMRSHAILFSSITVKVIIVSIGVILFTWLTM